MAPAGRVFSHLWAVYTCGRGIVLARGPLPHVSRRAGRGRALAQTGPRRVTPRGSAGGVRWERTAASQEPYPANSAHGTRMSSCALITPASTRRGARPTGSAGAAPNQGSGQTAKQGQTSAAVADPASCERKVGAGARHSLICDAFGHGLDVHRPPKAQNSVGMLLDGAAEYH